MLDDPMNSDVSGTGAFTISRVFMNDRPFSWIYDAIIDGTDCVFPPGEGDSSAARDFGVPPFVEFGADELQLHGVF